MKIALYNAKVYVEREKFVEAVLVEDRKIKAIGTNEEILATTDIDEKIDCEGKTVIPGLNDSHMHIFNFGERMCQVKIGDCESIDEMIDRCKKYVEENPDRVKHGLYAQGWNQDYFTDSDRIPTRFDLDKISTEIPVVLERICGHILTTNTKTIELLGIDAKSPQYSGGTFEIGKDGYPNGIFAENACNYAKNVIPKAVRLPSFIVIIAGFVTFISFIMKSFIPSLYDALGLFLSLITVNCIILGRAEVFASKNKLIPSIMDAIGMGLGFTLALFTIGSIREIIGAGKWMGINFNIDSPMAIFIMPAGGFFVFGLVIALVNKLTNKKPPAEIGCNGCSGCPNSAGCINSKGGSH